MSNQSKPPKQKPGPSAKALHKIKHNHLGIYLSDTELADLACRAGTRVPLTKPGLRSGGDTAARKKIAAYIRHAAFGSLPPRIPSANIEIWTSLTKPLSNLNQIAKKLNEGGGIYDADDMFYVICLRDQISELRKSLFETGT